MRRNRQAVVAEAADALEHAFDDVGLAVVRRPAPRGGGAHPDLVFEVGGQIVVVEVKNVVTQPDVARLVAQLRAYGSTGMVVAERIAEGAKEELIDAGASFYDRRGRLRLVIPGAIFVDAATQRSEEAWTVGVPFGSDVAKEVAIVLLSEPARRLGVREIARAIARSPSSVSEALHGLRTAGLVTSAHEPLVPDLFWELEAQWRRERYPLATAPGPFAASFTDSLQLGLGHGDASGWVLDAEGWALTDTLAAVVWGAPLVASADYPPDFYVPSRAVLQRARTALGRASTTDDRACTVSVAPVPLVCRRRVNRSESIWPVADHVVVALDLAKDRARGREALERWQPERFARVW